MKNTCNILRVMILLICVFVLLTLSGCARQRILESGADEVIARQEFSGLSEQMTEDPARDRNSEPQEEETPPEENTDKKEETKQTDPPRRTPSTYRPPTVVRPSTHPGTSGSKKTGGQGGNAGGKPAKKQDTKPGGGNKKDPGESKTKPEKQDDTIKVTLDPEGGKCSVSSVNVTKGGTYGDLPVPSRDSYRFLGWFTAASGGNEVTSSTKVTETGAHTLHAHWEKAKTIVVTFKGNGGRVRTKDTTMSVVQGDYYGTLPTPLREGYTFDGWFTASGGGQQVSEGDKVTASGNQTLYAHWSYEPYKYWSYQLEHTRSTMYSCQKLKIYWEYDEDNVTVKDCPLITNTNSINIAANWSDLTDVDDSRVKSKEPNVVIKCVSDYGNAADYAAAMRERFSGVRVLVLPQSAVNGSDEENLYYTLYLGQLLYPEWFTMEIGKVGSELGISGSIYE